MPPGMKDGEEADLGAEMFRIGGDGAQRFGGGAEENAVEHLFVLISDGSNLFRHGKNHVEVLAVEKLGPAFLNPLGALQRLA